MKDPVVTMTSGPDMRTNRRWWCWARLQPEVPAHIFRLRSQSPMPLLHHFKLTFKPSDFSALARRREYDGSGRKALMTPIEPYALSMGSLHDPGAG